MSNNVRNYIGGGGAVFDARGTEYILGTYIDANGVSKPVYQKVILFTTGDFSGSSISNFVGHTAVKDVLDLNVMLRSDTGAANEWLNATSYQTHIAISYKAGIDTLYMWSENLAGGWWWNKPAICTLIYTKTTD